MSGVLLSVVIPTYNEAENIPVLIERLEGLLGSTSHEIVVADDDSPDRTWEVAQGLAARYPSVRSLRRTRNRGLYPAVLDAFNASSGSCLAVLDADLQHDEAILPAMLDAMRTRRLKLVVGSRYVRDGGVGEWNWPRRAISGGATALARLALGIEVADPLSGFFLIDRETYLRVAPRLRPKGFKILMDILQNLPAGTPVGEVGYVFRPRHRGASKLGLRVTLHFLASLCESAVARIKKSARSPS